MPFTSNRGFSVQATGSNSGVWGSDGSTPTANSSNALNQGVIQLLDQALGQTTTLSLSSSNVTLTQLQCQSGMYRCTGTLTANVALSPDVGVLWTGVYCWENVTTGSFTVTITNSAGSVVLPQGRRGLMWIDTVNAPRIIAIAGSSTADAVPAGSVVPFYNSAAPSGYTVVALNDYALKVVSSLGGVTSGSVAYSTLFGRTETDSTVLTTNQIPSHTHGFTYNKGFIAANNSTAPVTDIQQSGGGNGVTTTAAGGGAGHAHGLDMRVQTAAVVLATRN